MTALWRSVPMSTRWAILWRDVLITAVMMSWSLSATSVLGRYFYATCALLAGFMTAANMLILIVLLLDRRRQYRGAREVAARVRLAEHKEDGNGK